MKKKATRKQPSAPQSNSCRVPLADTVEKQPTQYELATLAATLCGVHGFRPPDTFDKAMWFWRQAGKMLDRMARERDYYATLPSCEPPPPPASVKWPISFDKALLLWLSKNKTYTGRTDLRANLFREFLSTWTLFDPKSKLDEDVKALARKAFFGPPTKDSVDHAFKLLRERGIDEDAYFLWGKNLLTWFRSVCKRG